MTPTYEYRDDYPKKPIGGGNPYWCCIYCGISDPQINGRLENHSEYCKWRIAEENKLPIQSESPKMSSFKKNKS